MDERDRSAKDLYESSLSSEQKKLLKILELDDVPKLEQLFNQLSETKKKDKWFDYMLLTTAINTGHKSVIKYLLTTDCRAKIDKKTNFLCTPLYYAIERSSTWMVRELMKKGASIHDTDVNEISALEYAVKEEKIEVIEAFVRHRKYILDHENFDPHDKYDLALFQIACFKNNQQAVKDFLELKFSLDCRSSFDIEKWKGFTPLHFSVTGPRGSTVDILVRSKADILAVDETGRTPIHLAFRNNDDKTYLFENRSYFLENSYLLETWVKSLVDEDFSNLEDQYGLSFFHILCHGRDYDKSNKLVDAVKFFLRNNVDINHSVSLDDPHYPGYTALHFAVRNVRSDITKLILKHGADPTQTNMEGLTPLHVVLKNQLRGSATEIQNKEKERIEIVKSLINGGADVDVKDLDGDTPLHYVFSDIFFETENDEPVAQLLISASKLDTDYVSSRGVSYLHIASSTNLAAVKTLLETKNASLERCIPPKGKFKSGQHPLHLAVSFGKVDIVEYLLGPEVDPNMCTYNNEKMTPLHLVCKYTQNECYGIKGRSRGSLQSTTQSHGDSKVCIIELLLKNGASINKKDGFGSTPLLVACALPVNTIYSGELVSYVFEEIYDVQQKIIKTLLHNGADLHSFDNNRDSALHIIASQRVKGGCRQRKILAEILLMKGAKINVKNKSGLMPLHVAVRNSMYLRWDTSLVELFLKYGADVNAISPLGTPLHVAVNQFNPGEQIHEEIFSLLLGRPGIDLNIQTVSGNTPLHIAGNRLASYLSSNNSYGFGGPLPFKKKCFCIEELLIAGANVNILNVDGLTSLNKVFQWLMMDSSRSHQNYLDYFTFFMTYVKKLEKMNVFISDQVKESLIQLSKVDLEKSLAIEISIDEESEKLKSKMVDQYTSYYDILLKDANGMSKHVKNEEFEKIISSPDLCIDYPVFHDILKRKFEVGLARSLLLESAKEALETVLQVFWPYSCTEHILKYLSNENLKCLITSVPGEKTRKRKSESSSSIDDPRPKTAKFQ